MKSKEPPISSSPKQSSQSSQLKIQPITTSLLVNCIFPQLRNLHITPTNFANSQRKLTPFGSSPSHASRVPYHSHRHLFRFNPQFPKYSSSLLLSFSSFFY